MVEVLNAFGVKAACVGNHDFDYGIDNFTKLSAECHFPWLMANVLEVESGLPLGGASPTAIIEWQGVRVGLIGEWPDPWPWLPSGLAGLRFLVGEPQPCSCRRRGSLRRLPGERHASCTIGHLFSCPRPVPRCGPRCSSTPCFCS